MSESVDSSINLNFKLVIQNYTYQTTMRAIKIYNSI